MTSMGNMFYNSHKFNVDISAWDVSAVTSMNTMFSKTQVFNQNIAPWNVLKGGTSAANGGTGSMFKSAYAFNFKKEIEEGWYVDQEAGVSLPTWQSGPSGPSGATM